MFEFLAATTGTTIVSANSFEGISIGLAIEKIGFGRFECSVSPIQVFLAEPMPPG